MVTKGSNHPDPDGRTVFQMTGPLASTSRDQGPCARRKVTKETCPEALQGPAQDSALDKLAKIHR